MNLFKYPVVDIKTGKILNCKKNSLEYFHEKAHLDFSQSPIGANVQYFQQISETLSLISVVLSLFINHFKWFALIGIFTYLSLFIFEEVWCNYKACQRINL